ncbi:hypothetical protein C5Y96_26800 [Blastopirellula marina]|uniref:PepSY domain-containing protein n=1 Tax=Blastopirellula marina TaxID=124 RepID=A0A2S8EYY6_9BACT|nr:MULTISPECIES: hypothetical protein [Pirellulaceae]PQO25112.1 hypothetical protein C5Y96_26800 [Blastopirellula marina]RCS40963.1 hypothetical protein DTL36_26845 [Bremerella cremea]
MGIEEKKALQIAIQTIQDYGYAPELMTSSVRKDNGRWVVHFSLADKTRMGGDATVYIDSSSWEVVEVQGSQ